MRRAEEGLTTRMAKILTDPTFWDEVYDEWDKVTALRLSSEDSWRRQAVRESKDFWRRKAPAGLDSLGVVEGAQHPSANVPNDVSQDHLDRIKLILHPLEVNRKVSEESS